MHSSSVFPGNLVEVNCIDLSSQGYGISRLENIVIFTPNLLPSEKAIVKCLFLKNKSLWFSELISILYESDQRIQNKCSHFYTCGSCSLQHLSYQSQLDFKCSSFKETLLRIGSIELNKEALSIISADPFKYRTKAIIPFQFGDNNDYNFGYFKRKTHEIVPIEECPVLDARLEKLVFGISSLIKLHIKSNKINSSTYLSIRHISFRISSSSDEALVCFISSKDITSGLKLLSESICKHFSYVVGISNNIQPANNNVIFGQSTLTVWGRDFIHQRFCGLDLNLNSTSFFQVNIPLAEMLVQKIIDIVRDSSYPLVIDAFSGIGTISLPLSSSGINVIGLEKDRVSVKLANIAREIHHLYKLRFFKTDVYLNLQTFISSDSCLILDPPRKGLDTILVKKITKIMPKSIIYQSCNPSSLARDLKLLMSHGYNLQEISLYDFFPQTTHLESLVYLTRTI